MTVTNDVADTIMDRVTREIAERGLHAFSFDAFAESLAAEGIALREHFADEPTLLRAAARRTYRKVSAEALASISDATNGADALTAFVRAYVLYYFEHMDEYELSMAQIDHRRFAIDESVIVNEFVPIINPPLDAVEAKLLADRGSRDLPGGIHPRRLAFIGQVMAMGLVLSKDLTSRLGSPLKHGDDALLREACRALAGPIKSLRQLTALNEAGVELGRLRDEAALHRAVPALMASVLELEQPSFAMSTDVQPARSTPFEGGVELTAPVRYEGEIVGVITGRRSSSMETDERDIARLEAFASMVGLALENVRLYEDLQAQLEARTKRLTEAQRRLGETEKMAALGKLVASVVHELNTPLGVAQSSYAGLVRAAEKVEDKRIGGLIAQGAENAGTALHRISDIVAQLKRFSRLDAAEVESLDINTALADAVALLRHEIPEGCDVSVDAEPELRITCFASRVNQVLLNVIRNAVQADAKKVEVKAVRGSDDVRITVRDDGRGIAADDLARIFEPGFTAKGGRVRAGLGLATSYQIVADHGGEIRIESELARGTSVLIVLPQRTTKTAPASRGLP